MPDDIRHAFNVSVNNHVKFLNRNLPKELAPVDDCCIVYEKIRSAKFARYFLSPSFDCGIIYHVDD